MDVATKLLIALLRSWANQLEAGTCGMTEEQVLTIYNTFADELLNEEQACRELNMSRSTFHRRIADGILPQGEHKAGTKQSFWHRKALWKAVNDNKIGNK